MTLQVDIIFKILLVNTEVLGSIVFFFFQAEAGIRYLVRSRGLGDVYKRQLPAPSLRRPAALRSVPAAALLRCGDAGFLAGQRRTAAAASLQCAVGDGHSAAAPVSYKPLTLPTSRLG